MALANSAKFTAVDAYADVVGASENQNQHDDNAEAAWGQDEETARKNRDREPSDCIIDIREHDINYYLRVAIDLSELGGICPN
jgi:DNA polymerase epsilon subunit 1